MLQADPGYREQKMFGGLCFLLHGNMCAGVVGERLMLRLGDEQAAAVLSRPHVAAMDFTGRPMHSMVFVEHAGLQGTALERWVDQAAAYVRTLPAKGG